MSVATRLKRAAAACALLAATACGGGEPGLTITNVRILDGTGAPAVTGAVRIVGDSIVAVGDVAPARGDSIVDGGGLTLAPGFIDTHSHHDRGLRRTPEALGAVSQGITTIIVGADGGHAMPLAETMDSIAAAGPSVNVGWFAGHGSIRDAVMGEDFKRVATPAEVDSMAALLRRELDAGAFGLSTGLEYDPGIYSQRSEVLALAKVAAAAGARYASHIRSEDRTFWDAIDETIAIGREAKLPVQVSHVKLAMVPLWGQADSLLRLLDAARAEGIDVTADIYPYPYWSSTLTVLFPDRDFGDLAEARKVLREIAKPEGLLLGDFGPDSTYAGLTVAEIARRRGTDPAVTLLALINEALAWEQANPGRSGESVVATAMDEADIARLMQWPHANICSDGGLDGAHPRGFGAYPRVLGRYVREQGVVTLEEAVRKMTSLAAAHVGIARRGTVAPGMYADLVLFDPATVMDAATPQAPHEVAVGIRQVWVNGRTVFADGRAVSSKAGRVLRRSTR